jgi:peptidyl-tRNA hydrolase, PTH1 family
MSERTLIVGLGNPGREYKKNRHNVGFQTVDHFAARHGLEFTRQQSNAVIASGNIGGQAVTLAKPMTFMNRSGGPVSALMRFYKIEPEQLLVIVDDLDLPIGTVRLKPEGGSGGQNGMKDIIARLSTQNFARMRIGIGRPPGRMDSAAYVLQDFSADQQSIIDITYQRANDAIETWLREGIVLAMSRHNAPAEQE